MITVREKSDSSVYMFKNSEKLTIAINFLYKNRNTRFLNSELFKLNGKYYLFIKKNERKRIECIEEFSDKTCTSEQTYGKQYTNAYYYNGNYLFFISRTLGHLNTAFSVAAAFWLRLWTVGRRCSIWFSRLIFLLWCAASHFKSSRQIHIYIVTFIILFMVFVVNVARVQRITKNTKKRKRLTFASESFSL